jgi:hypothetical protein
MRHNAISSTHFTPDMGATRCPRGVMSSLTVLGPTLGFQPSPVFRYHPQAHRTRLKGCSDYRLATVEIASPLGLGS